MTPKFFCGSGSKGSCSFSLALHERANPAPLTIALCGSFSWFQPPLPAALRWCPAGLCEGMPGSRGALGSVESSPVEQEHSSACGPGRCWSLGTQLGWPKAPILIFACSTQGPKALCSPDCSLSMPLGCNLSHGDRKKVEQWLHLEKPAWHAEHPHCF